MTDSHSSTVEASAPASSANLGPGFDAIALALELRCRVVASPHVSWEVIHRSDHAPGESEDAVLTAARLAVGSDRPLLLEVHNDIPLGRGLGSSSAAYAAGALAGLRAVGEEPTADHLFRLVSDLEGHPDNAAASVYGGFVIVDGSGRCHRAPWSGTFRPVVAIPDVPFRTADARETLPGVYPTDVVVRSLGRLAALMMGLASGDAELIAGAAGDELHEEPRGRIRPDVAGLVVAARAAGAAHSCWSGAGPSVLALTSADSLDAVVGAMTDRLGDAGRVMVLEVASRGAY